DVQFRKPSECEVGYGAYADSIRLPRVRRCVRRLGESTDEVPGAQRPYADIQGAFCLEKSVWKASRVVAKNQRVLSSRAPRLRRVGKAGGQVPRVRAHERLAGVDASVARV